MSSCTKPPKKEEDCVRSCPGGSQQDNRASSTKCLNTTRNITFNATTTLPLIPQRAEKYTPMPFTFRIPLASLQAPINNSSICCPPFYAQLDHTLAVLWSLFARNNVPKELGIGQLQWAFAFLRNVRNVRGEYTKDVQICIKTIEDELLELYAEMVDEVKRIPKRKKSCSACCKKSSSSTSTEEYADAEDITLKQTYVKRNVPFSVNYFELLSRNADLKPVPQRTASCTSNKSCGSTTYTKPQTSTPQMIHFMNAWRCEQIKKIEAELRRLHSIENFIATTNQNDFQPYIGKESMDALGNQCPAERGNRSTRGG